MTDDTEETCIFCRIVRGEVPARMMLETDDLVAFRDTDPQAPAHVLVIPRRHVQSVGHAQDGDAELLGKLLLAAADLARREGFAEDGYRVVTNVGHDGRQSVLHLHLHVLAGRRLGWPPG